jgi:hypothetical protein
VGRPLGLVVLVLVAGITAVVMGYGALEVMRTQLVWRNALLLVLMLVTAISSIANGIALWRRAQNALTIFVVWYVALSLTLLSRHLYIAWSWIKISNLVVEVGLIALIGIVLGRYVRSHLLRPAGDPATAS